MRVRIAGGWTSLVLGLVVVGCGGGETGMDASTTDLGVDAPVGADASPDAPAPDLGVDLGAQDLGVDLPCPDADGDGHHARSCGGDDCDDADPTAYPGAVEVCDAVGHDEDCDPTTFGSLDADGDGVVSNACCDGPVGGARTCGTDCNDLDPTTNPTAPEVCDGIDNDCNGVVDDGLPTAAYYPDCDADAHGASGATAVLACGVPTMPPAGCSGGGWVMSHDDCDDAHASAYPGAIEHCDGVDDDCNGTVETDADGDMHWATGTCIQSAGELPADDCRDDLASVHPGAGYSAPAYCPAGMRICNVFFLPGGMQDRCIETSVACPGTGCAGSCATPSFDFNCDGVITRAPAVSGTPMCPGYITCSSGTGYIYDASAPPACGASVTYLSCRPVAATLMCGASASTVPLPCR